MNKYRQAKVIGMLRKLAKQEKHMPVALSAVKMLMMIEGLGQYILYGRAPEPLEPLEAESSPIEATITADVLRELLEDKSEN
jgi:hypothetical protein